MFKRIKIPSLLIWLVLLITAVAACSDIDGDQAPARFEDTAPGQPSGGDLDGQERAGNNPAIPTPLLEASLTYQTLTLADGTALEYALLLPAGYEEGREYPILLALPPGGQTREMVDAGLNGYWAGPAAERGWIVISPVAPGGILFFQGSEALIPEFLDQIANQYLPEGGKFHLAGISNGGISAFRLALNDPERFQTIVVLPGFPRGQDNNELAKLRGIPVKMYVGELDDSWREAMLDTEQELKRLGVNASLEILTGEGHVLSGVSGEQLFDLLDSYRRR